MKKIIFLMFLFISVISLAKDIVPPPDDPELEIVAPPMEQEPAPLPEKCPNRVPPEAPMDSQQQIEVPVAPPLPAEKEVPPPLPVEKRHTKKPQKEDYENTLKNFKSWSENVDNEERYKDFVLKFKDSEVGFDDLRPQEKDFFYLFQCELISHRLAYLHKTWVKEYHTGTSGVPNKKLKTYLDELTKLRQDHAQRFEKLAAEKLEKNKVSKEEKETYLRQVKEWNIREHLVRP